MRQCLFLCLLISFSLEAVVSEKVLICGVCRNVERYLPATIQTMERMGSLFEDYRILVYENDSGDQTPAMLRSWTERNEKVVIQSEKVPDSELMAEIINRDEAGNYFRPELIARARNKVLDLACSETFKDFKYLIWLDMDFEKPPRLEGIVEVFESKREWDAVFAYGVDLHQNYWDWYAFRDARYPIGSEILANAWWYMQKSLHLDLSSDWYPVYSAFGGCGIYKKASIEGCRYSGIVTRDLANDVEQIMDEGIRKNHPQIRVYYDRLQMIHSVVTIPAPIPNLPQLKFRHTGISLFGLECPIIWRMSSFVFQYPSVCEHVAFHASMRVRGHDRLFINPRLMFVYSPSWVVCEE